MAAGIVAVMACSTTAQNRMPAPTEVVATVGSRNITLAEVDEKALQQTADSFGSLKLSQALYEARRASLDDIIGNILLNAEAGARGVDQAALVDKEVTARVVAPTDAEVAEWYDANRARLQGATLAQIREPIRNHLIQERTADARTAYIATLKAKTPVRITLEPPRLAIKTAGSPATGPAAAPIELVEFSDFQCPYCFAAGPALKQVFSTYGDRIRFVYRNFPLSNHPNARPAAEAAQCANEQGKFWPYHDRLFADQKRLSEEDLKRTAADLGLDAARFNACVDSHKYKDAVDTDIRDGEDAGVTGTPAFFINGRLLSGAQPFEAFKRVIDEELELKKR